MNAWTSLPLPLQIKIKGLHGIGGFNASDVYFAGHGGLLLHFDGTQVISLPVPTTRTLVSIATLDQSRLCVGGYDGMLLYGNRHGWRIIPTGTDQPILALASFQGKVCFPTPNGVYAFDGKNAPSLLIDLPATWVNGLHDAITVFGQHTTWLFDGQNLSRLEAEA